MASGDITPVVQWMRKRIYHVGYLYDLPELINHATGKMLSAKPYIRYLKQKYSDLYA